MLRSLDIRDLLIIEHLTLDFQSGLNVLTGETGAGKSILLDALGFVLGWRGRAELVRQGAQTAEVSAVFELPPDHAARAVLAEAGLPESDDLILRRINTKDGRKTAWINDRRVSGEILRSLSDSLVELHGQHDDRGLLDAKGHRAILDAFGGHGAAQKATRNAWSALRKATQERDAAKIRLAQMQAEEEYLRHAVAELAALDPQPGEEDQLDTRRRLMQGAEKIAADVARAGQALGLDGAEGAMTDALRWMEGVAAQAEGHLEDPLAALERALTELGEAASGVERCLDALKFNPAELEETEERLFALRGLARKHDVSVDALPALQAELNAQLSVLDAGADSIAALEAACSKAQSAYDAAAEKLSEARHKSAKRLDKAVSKELAPLKMERAEFTTALAEAPSGPDGVDDVAFRVATNPGAPAGALGKIASGGELSRFLLALKVCLTQDVAGLTMIFDEIDRGVGGATADAVGRRLDALAQGGQILVVTHSPQVAALGAHHWHVEKQVKAGQTLSTVSYLDAAQRVDEIARMLSADRVTDEARQAARSLLGAN